MKDVDVRIRKLWTKALNGAKVSEQVSFFELGGNSLQAVIFLEMLKKELEVEVEIIDLYNHDTLEKFITFIHTKTGKQELSVEGYADTYIVPRDSAVSDEKVKNALETYDANAKRHKEKEYRVMRFQSYFMKMSKSKYLGILCSVINIKNCDSEQKLLQALKKLIKEQEILRTGMRDDGKKFTVYSQENWEIPIIHVKDKELEWEDLQEQLENVRNCIKDFSMGHMMSRILVVGLSNGEYQVRVYTHHCIWDRMSHLLVVERLEQILKNEPMPDGICSYSEFAEHSKPSANDFVTFYKNTIFHLSGILLGYLRSIRPKKEFNITICWTPEEEYLEKFKKKPVEMTADLYVSLLRECCGFKGNRLPAAVLTNGRNKKNSNTLGMWINTILGYYDTKTASIVKTNKGQTLTSADNQVVVYEMLPMWLFKMLAYSLPIINYVGLYPDYQNADRDYYRITDLADAGADDILTKYGESAMENRVTCFISDKRIHCTMKMFAENPEIIEQVIHKNFKIDGGKV